jgi:hypothetical protein
MSCNDDAEPWRASKRFKLLCEFAKAAQQAIDAGHVKELYRLLCQPRDTRFDQVNISQRLYQLPQIRRLP